MLEYYQGGVEMIRRDLLTGHWIPYLERALKSNPCYDLPINGGEVAATILQNTAIGKVYTSEKYSGARRLRDAIVLGFQLQRIPGRDTGIPEWYTHTENELGLCSLMPSREKNDRDVTSTEELGIEEFEILHGDIHGFPDTVAFLKSLASLASLDIDFNSNDKTEKRRIRERVAAAGLFNWEVSSGVPDGKGVSSSAALEVATMSAIAAAHGLIIRPRELALLCQKVENHIVGAPCGVMDQMTSACGEANKLLAMVCQPAEVREHVNIPTHIRFWGIDSGLRHSVGGADYGSVRVGTFMGRQIIKSTASTLLPQATASSQDDSNGVIHDQLDEQDPALLEKEATLDYLCNLQPHRYEAIYRKILPEKMSGQTFLDMYGHHNDPVTTINPMHTYVLKDPTAHPIYENFHVNAFAVLLTAASTDEQLSALGELLYQSHYSYSKCGLGSDGTDRLITLVQQMQHRKKDGSDERKGTLFGAKITGGGSGGTVCVLGRNCIQSSEEIIEIQQRYRAATGHLPFIFEGSSPGAGKFGYLKIKRRIHARS